jgi:hypothetical protein
MVVVAFVASCKGGGGDESGASGSGSGESTTNSGPVGECEQAMTADACAAAAARGCAWIEVLHVAREGSVCTLLDAFEMCLPSTPPGDGCSSPPSCEPAEDPFISIQPDGTAWSMTTCGGPHPIDWMHCESGAPNADPPICSCACSLAT